MGRYKLGRNLEKCNHVSGKMQPRSKDDKPSIRLLKEKFSALQRETEKMEKLRKHSRPRILLKTMKTASVCKKKLVVKHNTKKGFKGFLLKQFGSIKALTNHCRYENSKSFRKNL